MHRLDVGQTPRGKGSDALPGPDRRERVAVDASDYDTGVPVRQAEAVVVPRDDDRPPEVERLVGDLGRLLGESLLDEPVPAADAVRPRPSAAEQAGLTETGDRRAEIAGDGELAQRRAPGRSPP